MVTTFISRYYLSFIQIPGEKSEEEKRAEAEAAAKRKLEQERLKVSFYFIMLLWIIERCYCLGKGKSEGAREVVGAGRADKRV